MDTSIEKVVVKTKWWGITPQTRDICEQCKRSRHLNQMDDYVQGMCKDCKYKQKRGIK
jgi:hypothetical protein